MKNHVSRLLALSVLALGLLATDNGWAYFTGDHWGWPDPEIDGCLGQGSSANGGNGWSMARYSGSSVNLGWERKASTNESSDIEIVASGASTYSYLIVEYYWDGSTWDFGQSRIYGAAAATGGCD